MTATNRTSRILEDKLHLSLSVFLLFSVAVFSLCVFHVLNPLAFVTSFERAFYLLAGYVSLLVVPILLVITLKREILPRSFWKLFSFLGLGVVIVSDWFLLYRTPALFEKGGLWVLGVVLLLNILVLQAAAVCDWFSRVGFGLDRYKTHAGVEFVPLGEAGKMSAALLSMLVFFWIPWGGNGEISKPVRNIILALIGATVLLLLVLRFTHII